MTIGEAISKDLTQTLDRIPKEVLSDVGREYKESIWETSEDGLQPNGAGRKPLNTKYARRKVNKQRQGFRDYVWEGTAKSTFTFETGEDSIGFGYDNSKAANYMKSHENKGQGHRMYPIETDSKSSQQKETIQFVADRIANVLNKPRIIYASATTTVR